MRTRFIVATFLLAAVLLLTPAASAHEHYFTDDDRYKVVLGDQNEPMYTFKFTNLDLIVSDNETGAPVTGVEGTLNATLIGPDGETLTMPLKAQWGSEGRYEFEEGYMYTKPGQYRVRLVGSINGTPVDGIYNLPGPRQSFQTITFPHEGVPTLLDLDANTTGLQERVTTLEQENQDLRTQVQELESRLSSLEEQGSSMDGATTENATPGFTLGAVVVASLLALAAGRRLS